MTIQRTISPVDGSVYVERTLAAPAQVEAALESARLTQRAWRAVPMAERAAILNRFCDVFESHRDAIAEELSWQMGRPIRFAPSEVRGTLERARHMIAIAPEALADIDTALAMWQRLAPEGTLHTIELLDAEATIHARLGDTHAARDAARSALALVRDRHFIDPALLARIDALSGSAR